VITAFTITYFIVLISILATLIWLSKNE